MPTLAELRSAYFANRLGLFYHFSTSTFGPREIESPGTAPVSVFMPTGLDIDQWIATAVAAGAKYVILTTKHQDGFCLWPSAYSTRGIAATAWYAANGSPDIVGLFATKARAAGLKVVFYFTIYDSYWESIHGGAIDSGNVADFTTFICNQLTELLTNYGTIDGIWTDSWGWFAGFGGGITDPATIYTFTGYSTIYAHIKALQPNCLLIENNHGYTPAYDNTDVHTGELTAAPFITPLNGANFEQAGTIRSDGHWFYHDGDDPTLLRTGDEIVRGLVSLGNPADGYGSIVLDVTPTTAGVIPDEQVAVLTAVGQSPAHQNANVAFGKSVTVSSSYPGVGAASNVTDGSYALGYWHSNGDADPWAEVDLGEDHDIGLVSAWNRADAATYRFKDVVFKLYDADHTLLATSPTFNPGDTLGGPEFLYWQLTSPVAGVRHVRLQRITGGDADPYFHTSEIQAFEPMAAPASLTVGDFILQADGRTLTGVFSAAPVGTYTDFSDWTINGLPAFSGSISGTTLTLTLPLRIGMDETVTVSYDGSTAISTGDADLDPFTDAAVENQSEKVSSVTVSGPTTGLPGVQSTDITVTAQPVGALFDGDEDVVTLHTGDDLTFAPSSPITPVAGNATATFKITAATPGHKTYTVGFPTIASINRTFDVTDQGAGGANIPAPTGGGAGHQTEAGTGAATIPAPTGAGSGVAGGGFTPVAGAGAANVPAPVGAGAGVHVITGSGAADLPAIVASNEVVQHMSPAPIFDYVPVVQPNNGPSIVASLRGISTKHGETDSQRGRMFCDAVVSGATIAVHLYSRPFPTPGSGPAQFLVASGTGTAGVVIDLAEQNASGVTGGILFSAAPSGAWPFILIPTFAVDEDVYAQMDMAATLPGYDEEWGLAFHHAKAMREIVSSALPSKLPHLYPDRHGLSAFVTDFGTYLPDLRGLANADQLRVAQASLVKALACEEQEQLEEYARVAAAARTRYDKAMEALAASNLEEVDDALLDKGGPTGPAFGSFVRG